MPSMEFKEGNGNDVFELQYHRSKDGGTYIFVKVVKAITEVLSTNKNSTSESGAWHDKDKHALKFFEKTNDESINKFITTQGFDNNVGKNLFLRNNINLGIFRIVGADKGVTIKCDGLISEEDAIDKIKSLKNFVKLLWTRFIKEVNIKCTMSICEL
jgi:hypothetical protein